MSGNRFEFLELGEGDTTLPHPAEAAGRDPVAERGPDGEPLAQVRDVDVRGSRGFVSRGHEDATATGALRNRLRAAPGALRVAETFGERGNGVGQFHYPTGLAVDPDGVLFVADSYNHRVQRSTPDGGGSPLGNRGNGRGQFLAPQGVATDADGAFYVVEQGNHRVQKYATDGLLQLVFGRSGARAGEFRGPTGIAVAPGSGDIYVSDTGNGRVQRFDAGGGFLGQIGSDGSGAAFSPQALAVDRADNLYVSDPFAGRVFRYDPLGRASGQVAPLFHLPRALACGEDGILYVADAGDGADTLEAKPRGRVLALHIPQNRALATVEKPGRGLSPLARPGGLAVAPSPDGVARGDLYVADTLNHRILRFLWE